MFDQHVMSCACIVLGVQAIKAQVEENTARLRRLTGLMQLGVEALKETDAISLLEACRPIHTVLY